MTPADRDAIVERLTESAIYSEACLNGWTGSPSAYFRSKANHAKTRLAETRRLIELVRAMEVEE